MRCEHKVANKNGVMEHGQEGCGSGNRCIPTDVSLGQSGFDMMQSICCTLYSALAQIVWLITRLSQCFCLDLEYTYV
jgi:hypothetical protein